MRSVPAAIVVALLAAAFAAGCSERASRLTGNERLLRGTEGLGTTFLTDTLVDRDAFRSPGSTLLKGVTLLAGRIGTYEARSLLRTTTWTLPDSATSIIDSVRFRAEYDDRIDQPLSIDFSLALDLAGAAWDSSTVSWPGPPLGSTLGSAPFGLAPYTIDLGSSAMGAVRSWSRDPAWPGLVLAIQSGSGVLGFKAGTARLEITYHTASDPTKVRVSTTFPTDVTIFSPEPLASGLEDSLVLGGLGQSEVLLHAPIAPPPSGFSINGAAFVAYVASSPFGTQDTSAEIRAYAVAAPWTEGSPVDTVNATPLTIIGAYRAAGPGDSIVVQVPVSLAIQWAQNPATNYGILLRVGDAIYAPTLLLSSRESTAPPRIHLTLTTPPPGRF